MVDLADLRALPLPILYVGATAIFLLAIAALRVISKSLPSKAPPVFEGLPFIGGIMKFASVSELHNQ